MDTTAGERTMEMTRFEKYFVNREAKARRNFEAVCRHLSALEVDKIHDVLELGCGIGGVSASLAQEYGMNVFGTDYDPQQIAVAKQMYAERDNLHFQTEDASGLSFAEESFDLVIAQYMFHHVAAWDSAAGEIARVLRPGGYLLWTDFSYPRAAVRVLRPIVKQYGLYTWTDILQAFTEAGLEIHHKEPMKHGLLPSHQVVWRKDGRRRDSPGSGP